MTSDRSLVALARPLPVQRRHSLPAIAAQRMLPAAGRTLAAAVVGLAAEYALRAAANRALASVVRSSASRTAPVTTRVVVTELVIIERLRRL